MTAGPSPPPPPPTLSPTTSAGTTSPGTAAAIPRPLPVKLLTKSVRAKKVKKTLKVKLRSSEQVTSLAAQLRKGTKRLGTGKLRQLNGAATLKLKVKKLKKGTYVLDLVGNDASGARRFRSYKL